MTARPDIAWSRELSRTSPSQLALWSGAALLMFAAHAGAAWWVMNTSAEPLPRIAGSAAIEVDLAALGFSEFDQMSAGEAAEAVEPTETEAVETETAESQPVTEPTTADAVQPEMSSETTPVETAQAEPVPHQTAEPAEIVPEQSVRAEVAPTAVSRLAEAVVSEVQIAALPPVESEAYIAPDMAPPVAVETVEPVSEVEQQVAALVHVPLPSPRPENVRPAPRAERQRAEQPKRQQRAPQRQAQRPSVGAGGQNQADTRKGTTQGSTQGRAAQQSAGATRSSEAGNAAVSNYPGQVARKLRRAVRPQRGRDRGEVVVSFTVGRSGSVSGIRVARGSGSANLDKAALDTVSRAAPFPPIPDAAGRSSWTFDLPIAFTR